MEGWLLVRGWLTTLAAALLAAAVGASAAPQTPETPGRPLRVLNVEPGTELPYPVALLRGEAPVPDGSILTVAHRGRGAGEDFRTTVQGGRFKALVKLSPGKNELLLSSGALRLPLRLDFRPGRSPYRVRFIYLTDQTGATEYETPRKNDPQNFAERIDTLAKLMQTFVGETMHELGYGRKSFTTELDAAGRVPVLLLHAPKPAADYYELDDLGLYREVSAIIQRQAPSPHVKSVVIMAFSHFDPASKKARAHTALGGGDLGLFGSLGMFTWPDSVGDVPRAFADTTPVDGTRTHDDSAFRSTYWALAATTMGAVLHELGHCFGLPHSSDPFDVMSRGFDHFNRVFTLREPPHARRPSELAFGEREVATFNPVSAARLMYLRHFQARRGERPAKPLPQARLDPATGDLLLNSPHGIGMVAVDADDLSYSTQLYSGSHPRHVRYSLSGPARGAPARGLRVAVMDRLGNETFVDSNLLLDPGECVRSWRVSTQPLPWKGEGRFPTAARTLGEGPPAPETGRVLESRSGYVDLTSVYPGDTSFRYAYARSTLRSDREQRVVLRFYGDDAARVWLNGVLVLEKERPEPSRAEVPLRPGENDLLLVVANRQGDWGFSVRFEAPATGARLKVGSNGAILPSGK